MAHDEGADDRPHPRKAVQPVHVPRLVVEGDIVVQRGVDRPRAQPVGDAEEEEHPEPIRKGEPEHRRRGEEHADHGDVPRTELFRQLFGQQAGNDGTARYDHRDDPHIGDGHAQVRVHGWPARTDEGVGQAEADEGDIDEYK